jgi:hypothetical protein
MEKKSGKHKIKQQVGAQELVAIVDLEVEVHDWEHDPQFSFPDGKVGCVAGATFGAKYALDYAQGYGYQGKSFRVTFKEVKGGGTGSGEHLVAVATSLAVFEALGIKPQRPPKFDPTTKIIAFPF